MPQHGIDGVVCLLLLALRVSAESDGHTQNDPTMRRILLISIVFVTGVAGWVGFRAYFPEQESKQSKKIATKIKKVKAKLPGWWEGGALGAGSNLQTLHETGEICPHEALQIDTPEEPPMELDPRLKLKLEESNRQKLIPPPAQPEPTQTHQTNEDSIHIQEPLMRQAIERTAMEGYLLLHREIDLEVRRVSLSQQRHLAYDESTAREDIKQEEDNDFSEVFMKIWEDSAAIQQLSDNETDIRYAIAYNQKCELSELVIELEDSHLLASTTHLRQQLSHDENHSRQQHESQYWSQTPRLFLSLSESLSRCLIHKHLKDDITSLLNSYWSESRNLCLSEGGYFHSEMSLLEQSSRLFISSVEDQIISDLRKVFEAELVNLKIIKMRVVVDGAVVRGSSNRRSSKVGVLSLGDIVLVEEVKFGRALLRSPRGWVSIQNQAGMTILEEINGNHSQVTAGQVLSEGGSEDVSPKHESTDSKPSSSPPAVVENTDQLSAHSEEWGESQSIDNGDGNDIDNTSNNNIPSTPEHHQPDPVSLEEKAVAMEESNPPKKRPILMKKKSQPTPTATPTSTPTPAPTSAPTQYTRSVNRNIVVKAGPTRTSAKVGTLSDGDRVEVEQELTDLNLVLIKNPRGYIPASCLKGSITAHTSWSPVSQDYSQVTPPRSPSMASFASSVQSTLIDDFREIVLHKSEDQKLGICFAENSRLVLESCIPGSASQENGLEAVLGHRLIKINGINVREKPDIVPFVRETTLHLVFSKSADSGWDPVTKTWSRRRKAVAPSPSQVADRFASMALSGFQGIKKWSTAATQSERPPAAVSKAD
eukprot:TRINITY_DN2769_c0_g1_i1.p1 TRINITY_DN2769_c0_g1~~TRINITY_DN2769_c0_g1_i1.p1  ORF type:complete len:820 (+),score=163.52 TRINITY_DN2769_c0_g1_i1:83-2542(+)